MIYKSKNIVLNSYIPTGIPTKENFSIKEIPLELKENNQVLVKQVNKYGTSIEPWNGLGEREILQPRGVRYKVQSVKTTEFEEMGEEFTFTEIILQAL